MEIKAKLQKPCTELQKTEFIVRYNHELGYLIDETDTELLARWYTNEELYNQEKERVAKLNLTRGDVFRGLLLAKGITREQLRISIENNVQLNDIQKEMALIDFDEALNFYRGNSLINTIGESIGISAEQLDNFFETNDFNCLKNESEVNLSEGIL